MLWGWSSRETSEGRGTQATRSPFHFWRSAGAVTAGALCLLVAPSAVTRTIPGSKNVVARLHGDTLKLERLETFVEKLSQRRSIHLRPVRFSEFKNDWERIATLYNRIWAQNWGFAPMSAKDFSQEMAGFGLIAPPECFQVCYAGDEPIGLALALPDMNVGAKACDGKMLPFGWWKFFSAVKRTHRFRLMMLGIVPEHWKTGADVVLVYQMIRGLLARGLDDCEAGWILEDNYLMIRMLERLGGKISKHYSIFGMSLQDIASV